MNRELSFQSVEAAVWGGAFLGGGGGGWPADGLAVGRLALEVGTPRLVSLAELPGDVLVVTVSAVGAPSAPDRYLRPADHLVALQTLDERLGGRIGALMSSENGGAATLNGWFQSAMTGLPVADAACDGRAHPTGVMGSMGLETEPGYRSLQAAVGGNPSLGRRIRLVVEGDLEACDGVVRQAAVAAGGMVAVARNPVAPDYVGRRGAPGAISLAISLGEIVLGRRAEGGEAVATALAERMGGAVLGRGRVRDFRLETRHGYDVGRATVGEVELTFWNEYMTAERKGRRLATFPDLIATLDAETGEPVVTAALREGLDVVMVSVPKTRLPLGSGVLRPENLRPAEEAVGKALVDFL